MCSATAIVLALLTTMNVDSVAGREVTRQRTVERNLQLENQIFSDNLLFESSALSDVDCGQKCLRAASCEAFTFVKPTTCWGHSSAPTTLSPSSPAPGAETWVFMPDCVEADLDTRYLTYPNTAYVPGNQEDDDIGRSLQQCQDWCTGDRWCRAVEFRSTDGKCHTYIDDGPKTDLVRNVAQTNIYHKT
ncbi:hypothetical protein BaRGS_00012564, partial [Batillaria attramentaria]